VQLPDAIDRIRPSIVQIGAVALGAAPGQATLGTGFVVTSAIHVITAKHVVDGINSVTQEGLQVGFAAPTSTRRS
jgi:hypothetical protein